MTLWITDTGALDVPMHAFSPRNGREGNLCEERGETCVASSGVGEEAVWEMRKTVGDLIRVSVEGDEWLALVH